MDLLFLILNLTLIIIVILFVIKPFFVSESPTVDTLSSRYDLQERHTRLIESLYDLDLDHSTGKVTDADYATVRRDIIGEGIDILHQIDDAEHIDS